MRINWKNGYVFSIIFYGNYILVDNIVKIIISEYITLLLHYLW